ncbi:phosphoribosylformylglycinamidine synthase I [Alkaliphilus metalliredigens QYMF]|uniref:Phosphoribosylformylglycinamidine synthase subunit PurQ n=1 Tax=Alkaliphilus metalliredigens (strain QYMF) TaxID=293826 RepID=PURQ_ALKMQ|nr:phosphoribosylformylglycinamidine synthase subunit PurQ [Alkaliphilus metalliredigens]A6TLS2.1 RecName: Full=Phosphoribosylformylglycinamidine synthase subunit PurQ; Short=FGAM synthase; AltName: Full=Formylglycinamide ribonucleotide amidotransferase subunit I; Short=FGAR amidotransferase I; Short=FGAR-AT I; AltName: Full=Glutaminase PurQ; AltName: Full=Phosphoribosylformylglycinamidine synthase subunit I [Alkaliphilus metalliredigens QYMF]ABR47140.1 phosphoribosylformylglycinamidine synthase 
MRFGIVVFPGSNCDIDCYYVLKDELQQEVEYIWHEEELKEGFDCIILPGGFSYGDYLRCGAVAQFSKVMEGVKVYAHAGGLVVGICNGFQILTEAGLLPGALVRNKGLKFICDTTPLKVTEANSPFTNQYQKGEVIQIPIAHGEGNYVVDEVTLAEMKTKGQILFTYGENPNGSTGDIAGICNEGKNVMGLMPHPERASEALLGNVDGKKFFQSIMHYLEGGKNND